jgi:hypothetical protein
MEKLRWSHRRDARQGNRIFVWIAVFYYHLAEADHTYPQISFTALLFAFDSPSRFQFYIDPGDLIEEEPSEYVKISVDIQMATSQKTYKTLSCRIISGLDFLACQ